MTLSEAAASWSVFASPIMSFKSIKCLKNSTADNLVARVEAEQKINYNLERLIDLLTFR